MKMSKRVRMWGFLISLFIFSLFSDRVFALQVSLSGDTSLAPGTTITYNLNIDAEQTTITGFTTTIQYDSNVLVLTGVEPNIQGGWSGDSEGGNTPKTVSFTSTVGSNSKFIVAKLTFRVKEEVTSNSATITLRDSLGSYKDADGVDTQVGFPEKNYRLAIKSTDDTLSDLKINGKSIDKFASDVYDYEVKVNADVSSAQIYATTTSANSTLKTGNGNRTVSLNYGNNIVTVIVLSESGAERVYTVNIIREDDRSSDTTLASLTVDGESVPNFKSNTYRYNVKKYKAETVTIIGLATDKSATVKVDGPEKMVVGDNTYTITVTSEKGDTATYTIIITNSDKDINKRLKELSIKGYEINFDRNNYRYEIAYNKEKFKNLHVYFTTMGTNDEVTAVLSPDINNDAEALAALRPGDEITITITGIDGEKALYTIVINKDNRISFFLVVELFIMLVIAVIFIIIYIRRKKEKDNIEKEVVHQEKKNVKKTTKQVVVPEVEVTKPKKKRFSIYEDEYEEVEVEDDNSKTKEFKDDEFK